MYAIPCNGANVGYAPGGVFLIWFMEAYEKKTKKT
jgi:hypothetical protein